jgi:transposase-like protein
MQKREGATIDWETKEELDEIIIRLYSGKTAMADIADAVGINEEFVHRTIRQAGIEVSLKDETSWWRARPHRLL